MTLENRLRAAAPLRLDRYIEACLWDEEAGYYRRQEVFGSKGDFVTAPEISPIFGEVIALWSMEAWRKLGEPTKFALLEMGAGRGQLMQDFLRIARLDAGFIAALNLFILEKSPARRTEQSCNIDAPVVFLDALDLPPTPALIISNEFFDALPIRQFRNEDGGWLEAFVDENLQKTWQACARPPKALRRFWNQNGIVEICEPTIEIAAHLGAHLRAHKGAMLSIDYGDFDGVGDTFQAVKNHQMISPFDAPGEADLTAHVRFRDLAEAAELDCDFMTQAEFLAAYGGAQLLERHKKAQPALAEDIEARYHRLTAEKEMGTVFKVLIQKALER